MNGLIAQWSVFVGPTGLWMKRPVENEHRHCRWGKGNTVLFVGEAVDAHGKQAGAALYLVNGSKCLEAIRLCKALSNSGT